MVKTQNWGKKYTSEKSARAAHLRKHPGDLHWVQVPKKGADRKDLPPGWGDAGQSGGREEVSARALLPPPQPPL